MNSGIIPNLAWGSGPTKGSQALPSPREAHAQFPDVAAFVAQALPHILSLTTHDRGATLTPTMHSASISHTRRRKLKWYATNALSLMVLRGLSL